MDRNKVSIRIQRLGRILYMYKTLIRRNIDICVKGIEKCLLKLSSTKKKNDFPRIFYSKLI